MQQVQQHQVLLVAAAFLLLPVLPPVLVLVLLQLRVRALVQELVRGPRQVWVWLPVLHGRREQGHQWRVRQQAARAHPQWAQASQPLPWGEVELVQARPGEGLVGQGLSQLLLVVLLLVLLLLQALALALVLAVPLLLVVVGVH